MICQTSIKNTVLYPFLFRFVCEPSHFTQNSGQTSFIFVSEAAFLIFNFSTLRFCFELLIFNLLSYHNPCISLYINENTIVTNMLYIRQGAGHLPPLPFRLFVFRRLLVDYNEVASVVTIGEVNLCFSLGCRAHTCDYTVNCA